MLTTVAAREPWEAHLFRGRLEAEGIPAFVVHPYHIGNAWHYSTALGGVKVQVSDECRDEAWVIERRCAGGEFRLLLESEFGNIDDVHCPYCESRAYRKRRPIPRAVIAVLVSVLFLVVLPPVGWVYVCQHCGEKFRQPLCPDIYSKWPMILTAMVCELVLLLGLGLCVRLLGSRYGFMVVVVPLLLAGRFLVNNFSKQDNEQD